MNPKNIINRLTKPFKSKDVDVNPFQAELAWQEVGGSKFYDEFKSGDYENAYPSITKIMQGFASIEPYIVDKQGKVQPKHEVLDNLFVPNKTMSAYDFREALMMMFLVWDNTYIRVHTNGNKSRGKINYKNITGFTFLEDTHPTVIEGKRTFMLNGETITDDEVLVLHSANPYKLTQGFSTSRAARRWTRLDDYIADYQSGFFKNGAVPAGQFVITAPSLTEFQDIKRVMQEKHQGAGKNNNVTYSYRPVDSQGKQQQSQIEWIPYNQANKDLALKDLLENVNQKVDSAFGVPSEIRGHLENSNYASVNVAEKVFVNYTLRPLTFKLWNKFSHELQRVTGGFDGAITFDLLTPQVAAEEKEWAEKRKIETETVTMLTTAGYELKNIVAALQLDAKYLQLGEAVKKEPENPETPTTEELGDLPEQPLETITNKMSKQLTPSERDTYERELAVVIRAQLNRQVTKVINSIDENLSKAVGDTTDEEDEQLAKDMLTVLVPLVYIYGRTAQAGGMALLVEHGLNTQAVKTFTLTPEQQKLYANYLDKVATGFNEQTAEAIRNTLQTGISQGLPAAEIKSNLNLLIDDSYRVNRLAVTEVGRTQNRAGLSAMENIQRDTGYEIVKTWRTTGVNPCPICSELNGKSTPVNNTFWEKGSSIIGTDGKEYVNTFVDADTADAHPHCQCIQEYEVKNG